MTISSEKTDSPSPLLLRESLRQLLHDIASPRGRGRSPARDVEEIHSGVFKPLDDDALLGETGAACNDCIWSVQFVIRQNRTAVEKAGTSVQSWQFSFAAMTNFSDGSLALMALIISRMNGARFSRLPPYCINGNTMLVTTISDADQCMQTKYRVKLTSSVLLLINGDKNCCIMYPWLACNCMYQSASSFSFPPQTRRKLKKEEKEKLIILR